MHAIVKCSRVAVARSSWEKQPSIVVCWRMCRAKIMPRRDDKAILLLKNLLRESVDLDVEVIFPGLPYFVDFGYHGADETE